MIRQSVSRCNSDLLFLVAIFLYVLYFVRSVARNLVRRSFTSGHSAERIE